MDNQKILNSLLDSSDIFEDSDEEMFRDYISSESIEAIEYNLKFFTDVPRAEIKTVLTELLILVSYYEHDVWNYTFPKIILTAYIPQEQDTRPITKINQDLIILKKYKKVLDRLFNLKSNSSDDGFMMIRTNDEQIDISTLYKMNNKLIKDLEEKRFFHISKSKYYEQKAPSKQKIKDFLKKTRQVYNLKGVSLEEKQLCDSIPSTQN